jgi:hypothetical protein
MNDSTQTSDSLLGHQSPFHIIFSTAHGYLYIRNFSPAILIVPYFRDYFLGYLIFQPVDHKKILVIRVIYSLKYIIMNLPRLPFQCSSSDAMSLCSLSLIPRSAKILLRCVFCCCVWLPRGPFLEMIKGVH